ncbi:DUF3304 domain-containing protein [Iodobacter ciconiae]|uniref:DUF3304 domain-containing protein n=1 Tax=Iodobacter ciconiae TaxID=2496266 RepID=UPI0013DF90CA|nr:DUF3304 domain-containing protein [Iodobacter ciconiae]
MFKKYLCVLFVPLLFACQKEISSDEEAVAAASKVPADSVSVSVDEVNYNADLEIKYTAFDVSGGGSTEAIAGGIVVPLAAGGAKSCCVNLPKVWRPGIKIKVEWQEADKEIRPEIYRQALELPRYQKPGDVYLVFYPEHQLEVIASHVEPSHPDWPGKIKEPPLEACLQKNTKKFCMQSLPKYGWGTPDWKANNMRETCNEKGRKSELNFWKMNSLSKPELDEEIKNNKNSCLLMQKECLEKWNVSNKKMCSFEYED